MSTYKFTQVSHTAKRRVTCATCGKKFNRQRTFTHTVNPFNKNADGLPKDPLQVHADVMLLAYQWQPEPDCGKHEGNHAHQSGDL